MSNFIYVYKKPSLVHFVRCHPKLWNKKSRGRFTRKPCKDTKKWYIYASKTNYYKEKFDKYMNIILNKVNIKKVKSSLRKYLKLFQLIVN